MTNEFDNPSGSPDLKGGSGVRKAAAEPHGVARGRSCPICKAPTSPPYRPFCSRRCADVDLSRWLSGRYAIPGGDADEDEDGDQARAAETVARIKPPRDEDF